MTKQIFLEYSTPMYIIHTFIVSFDTFSTRIFTPKLVKIVPSHPIRRKMNSKCKNPQKEEKNQASQKCYQAQ